MTTLFKRFALAAVTIATASVASASTFAIGSHGIGSTDSSGFSNGATLYSPLASYYAPFNSIAYALNPGSVWHAPIAAGGSTSSWVGKNPNDGPGSPTPNVEPNGTYTYFSSFNFDGFTSQAYGSLSVLADDTVNVWLNGHSIFNASNNTYNSICNEDTPNCTMVATAPLLASDFVEGNNILEFDVLQSAGGSTGLDFAGTISTTPTSPTPEPTSLLLLGTGLVGSLGVLLRRKRRIPALQAGSQA